jgi:hypothetical protein
LGCGGEKLKDVVNLIFETALLVRVVLEEEKYGKHFVCLVENKHFDVVGAESTTILNHI